MCTNGGEEVGKRAVYEQRKGVRALIVQNRIDYHCYFHLESIPIANKPTVGQALHSGKPKASIQAYQGPADAERWAKISDFKILRIPESK